MSDRFAQLFLDPYPGAPARARGFLTEWCRYWKSPGLAEAGGIVVSELVTNAVVHAGTGLRVDVFLAEGALTVAVHDRGAGEVRPAPPGRRGRLGGFGLAIVVQLAESWGVITGDLGKTVWCRLLPAPAL